MPAPRIQKSARSGRYRCHVVHATTPRTSAPAAYRAAIGPGSTASRSVNGPFMNHQSRAKVVRPTTRRWPANAYGAYNSATVATNPARNRTPSLRVSAGTATTGANFVSAANAAAAPALMGARANRITSTNAKSPRGSRWPLHATLDHQQRAPEVEQLGEAPATARDGRDTPEQPAGAEVEPEPEQLRLENRAARQRDREERKLCERRVDGRHVRVVDQPLIDRTDLRQLDRGGRVAVWVDARELHLAVPQVSIDVGRQLGRERQQDQAHCDGDAPDVQVSAPGVQNLARANGIRRERPTEDEQPHPRKCRTRPPPEAPEQRQLHHPGDGQEAPGLGRIGVR